MNSKSQIIQIDNLTKMFGSFRVLNNVSLSLDQGDVFYLLGSNGSGKTTLINCLLAVLEINSGTIQFFGNYDFADIKKRIGVVMEEDGFLRDLSVEKNMKIACLLKEVSFSEIPFLLKLVSLDKHRNKMVKKLSQGMRKRLSIACSLVGNPDLIIWDEPYNGLDPTGFQFMRNMIKQLSEDGKTIFISTHLLDEVYRTANKVALIYNGKIQEVISVSKIETKYGSIDEFYSRYVYKHNNFR